MADHITANLPSRDFDLTVEFYGALGFAVMYRDDGWMILQRGDMIVEFFAHPKLKPAKSWFSACIRTDDLDALYTAFSATKLSDNPGAIPRLTAPMSHTPDMRIFALVDPDGSLLRCIQIKGTT
ncbi:MAG: bleomycin resistance protein [Yoonia sp.]